MDERDTFSFIKTKNKKISFIHKINRGNIEININLKMVMYCLFIFAFLLLLIIVIIFYIKNKNLYKEINKRRNKNKTFNRTIIEKKLFIYKEDEYKNNNNLTEINISYSLDNQLIYPTLVSMISGLENNKNISNLIVYHLLLSHDFNTSKIEIFESLKKNYTVKINYYLIPQIFPYSRTWNTGTDCVYYKIILPLMFPDYKRIIYLDGDTLIRKDISEMYNYPFNDNYILGFPFFVPFVLDKYRINATHYINGGCLLINIEKIRKEKKDVDLLKFTITKNDLRFREQDSINYIFYPKIGFLPLKYGIYMIGKRAISHIFKMTRSPLNITEGYESVEDPALVHFSCCLPKVWTNGSRNLFQENNICLRYQKEFYYYANKTQYYSEIYNSLFYPHNKK